MKPTSLIYSTKCELSDALDNLNDLLSFSSVGPLSDSINQIISLVDTAYNMLNDLNFD